MNRRCGRAMVAAAVVQLTHGEVADAVVEEARHHGFFGQQHHAVVHQHAVRSGPERGGAAASTRRGRAAAAGGGRLGRVVVGVRGFDFDVFGEGHRSFDKRPARVERTRTDASAAAELGHVRREQPCHLDHRRIVLAERLDVEGHDDRAVVRGIDRPGDRRGRIRHHVVGNGAEQNPIAPPFPPHDAVAGRLPAVARPEGRARNLADPEELASELSLRDLVVEAVLDPVDREHAIVRLRVLCDDAVIRPDLRLRRAPAPAAARLRLFLRGRVLREGQARNRTQDHGNRQTSHLHLIPPRSAYITGKITLSPKKKPAGTEVPAG